MLKSVTDVASRLEYWTMRSLRRATPQILVDFLLDRGIYLKPGLDTAAPLRLAHRYRDKATALGHPIEGAELLVVGFGGSLGIGIHLLELGASRVVLQDPFAPPRHKRIGELPAELRRKYLDADGQPRGPQLTVRREHLDSLADEADSFDLIVSNSVLEHVGDLGAIARGCRLVMKPGGLCLHCVDLRDHYFRYPFEMLCYSDEVWDRWLNASNNLNRLRMPDYRRVFAEYFERIVVEPVEWLHDEFAAYKPRIRPEFLTGNDSDDAAITIWVQAS
ncbi:MAG: class I SAM-dependent methyltransferase [Deltaproteobacteria bacterium]|nr:class I SAM-dependent methyltransferase [Deltaproteobacteria bacterium]